MENIEVRLAARSEERACLNLLPGIRQADAELLVASRSGVLVGAAAVRWLNWNQPRGFPVAVFVKPEERHRSAGRRLMEELTRITNRETDGLWAIRAVESQSIESTFLMALGFNPEKSVHSYRVNTNRFFMMIFPIVDRMTRIGKIPRSARVVSLRDVPFSYVLDLAAQCLQQDSDIYAAEFLSEQNPLLHVDLDASVATLIDGNLVGATFGKWSGGNCQIDANIVHPAYRKTFVNAIQLCESTRRIRQRGSRTFEFSCGDDVVDSLNLARRSGAELIARKILYYKPST